MDIDLTAKKGDWRWAGAMGYAGHKVRHRSWVCNEHLSVEDGFWEGHGVCNGGPSNGDHWELYEEPKPEKPERVRWQLGWYTRGNNPGVFCLGEPGEHFGTPAETLPSREINGYCFNAWVYLDVPNNHDTGRRELVLPARYMPIYVSERGGLWSWDRMNQEDCVPVWPDEVEMIKVKEEENV